MHATTGEAIAPARPPDTALLSAWALHADEAAFEELVARHLSLVRGVAVRRLADEHGADEVTQIVFAILARKAASLTNVRVLAAWLHRVTLAQSARAIRSMARERRLRLSAMQHASLTETGRDPLHEALPHLDEAISALPERDRILLFLRYNEGLSFADTARRLGRSEAALRQQSGRAIERLAATLRRRGVMVPATAISTGLGAAIDGGTTPVCAAAVAQAALAAAPCVSVGTLILTSILTMSPVKITTICVVAALSLIAVPAVRQGMELKRLRAAAALPSSATLPAGSAVPAASAAPSAKAAVNPAPVAPNSRALPDMEKLSQTMKDSMTGLMSDFAERQSLIEARRIALALALPSAQEASLRDFLTKVYLEEMDGEGVDSWQLRAGRRVVEYLAGAVTPEQLAHYRDLVRQRTETVIEKVAGDAFHAVARMVDLTAGQKDTLFRKFTDKAREAHDGPWRNGLSMGAAIAPRPPAPLESDDATLRNVLTPEQWSDWQVQHTAVRDLVDNLPQRMLSSVFAAASGEDLAGALEKEFNNQPDAAPSKP